ncbi:MAG: nickel pincer cofactor biosynthesis protein LarC [Nitrospirae bacterium]|nr:nickel pincer cofactor biosynthesis protein LarC [Nitrospirota bacterium]
MKDRLLCHIDCSGGASGDMMLGALVDAGVPVDVLRGELAKLGLAGYSLRASKVTRCGLAATKLDVIIEGGEAPPLRKWADVRRVIASSGLDAGIKKESLSIMKRLFEAEAAAHGTTVAKTHLHELGAVDCIVDIAGAVIGLQHLGVSSVTASPVNTGSGFVKTAHGTLPVPAPATAYLLRGAPVFASGAEMERTTPTGAAILSSLSSGFGNLPEMTLERVGIGAGGRDLPDSPNALRLFIGKRPALPFPDDDVTVIETNIDDMDPRLYEHVMDRLFKAGALDVFLSPIIMKKSRPATKLTAICRMGDVKALSGIILAETTTFGVRVYGASRRILDREFISVKTKYGDIRVKIGRLEGRVVTATPEYEDCRAAAERHNAPIGEVIREAEKAGR